MALTCGENILVIIAMRLLLFMSLKYFTKMYKPVHANSIWQKLMFSRVILNCKEYGCATHE